MLLPRLLALPTLPTRPWEWVQPQPKQRGNELLNNARKQRHRPQPPRSRPVLQPKPLRGEGAPG